MPEVASFARALRDHTPDGQIVGVDDSAARKGSLNAGLHPLCGPVVSVFAIKPNTMRLETPTCGAIAQPGASSCLSAFLLFPNNRVPA